MNKEILNNISDIEDYLSDLTEIKTNDKNIRRYRTEAIIDKVSFIVEVK